MVVWSLLTHTHAGPKVYKPEYLIYAVLVFAGWQCSCGSIKEYFCEKIYMSQNKEQRSDAESVGKVEQKNKGICV